MPLYVSYVRDDSTDDGNNVSLRCHRCSNKTHVLEYIFPERMDKMRSTADAALVHPTGLAGRLVDPTERMQCKWNDQVGWMILGSSRFWAQTAAMTYDGISTSSTHPRLILERGRREGKGGAEQSMYRIHSNEIASVCTPRVGSCVLCQKQKRVEQNCLMRCALKG
jgi:hypothetical protein